jgi:hypothetical protein
MQYSHKLLYGAYFAEDACELFLSNIAKATVGDRESVQSCR